MLSYGEILDKLLDLSDETEVVEFKAAKDDYNREKLGQYFSALSNEANLHRLPHAWFILGVKDKTHECMGTQFLPSISAQNEIKKFIGEQTSNNLTFQDILEINKDGKRVVMLKIPAAPKGIPVSFKRHFYGRDGESLVGLSLDKIERIRSQIEPDWSAEVIEGASFDDLDSIAIKRARELFCEKNPNKAEEMKKWDDITFLNKAKITLKGKITRTALLLLGKEESEYMLHPAEPKIRWILRDSKGDILSHYIAGLPLLISMETIYSKIRNLKYLSMRDDSLFPEEVDQYDPFTIREALANCIAHQDYQKGMRVNVVEKEDRLIFQNGGLFIPESVEQVIKEDAPEAVYRNHFLVTAMTNLKLVETAGGGIRKMFLLQRNRYFPLPDYDLSDNKVTVTIIGKVLDNEFAELLKKNRNLSLEEVIALDKVSKRKPLSDFEVKQLKKKKLIEGRKPNYYFSEPIAAALDKKAEYTNIKGFDNSYYRDLILKALKEHKSLTRTEIEEILWNKLPDNLDELQKKRKIDSLLRPLRNTGKILNKSSGRRSIWKLANDEQMTSK